MVSAMPVTRLIKVGQWALVLAYALLTMTLQPLLLEHSFAAGTTHEHSDQDICAWLDHAASTALQSVTLPPVLVSVQEAIPLSAPSVWRSVVLLCDSVRPPPSFFSSSAIRFSLG